MTPWTATYQAPPSMGFSMQEYWSGVPLPSPYYMLLSHKKERNKVICRNMVDLQIIKLREVSQTEKQKSYITCMWNLKKNDTNELIYKAEIDIEKKLMVN